MVGITLEKELEVSKGTKIFLFLAILFLLLSVVTYFVLENISKKVTAEIASLETSLEVFNSPENISLEKEVLAGRDRINYFSQLIGKHLEVSKVFGVVEKITHPKVWFTSFSLDSKNSSFNVSGEAEGFEALGQQIIILKNSQNISDFNLSEISTKNEEGRVSFSISASVIPSILAAGTEQ